HGAHDSGQATLRRMPAVVYRFADYRLDPAARELQRNGELVALPPRAFDCMAYLVERRERAVGRDELIAAVWGKVDVSDTLLAQTILRVRRAVGDTGNEQNVVRTVPRFGYRWVLPTEAATVVQDGMPAAATEAPAPARPAQAEPDLATSPPAAARPDASPRRRASWIWLLLAAALALLVAQFARTPSRTPPDTTAPAGRSAGAGAAIVLPVEVDEGAEWSWIRLGGMDFLASQLRAAGHATLPSDTTLVLLSRNAAVRSPAADLKTARDSGARLVLAPRAQREGDGWRVRIAATAADGTRRDVEGTAGTVLDAGRLAMSALIGANAATPIASGARAEHLQRAEAALLGDDLDLARRELDAVGANADDAEIVYRRSQIDFRAGDYEALDGRLLPLLETLDAQHDAALRGQVLNGLGSVAIRRNRMQAAERYFTEAVALLRPGSEVRARGQAYTGLAITQAAQQRFDDALATFADARVELENAGDALAVARIDANLGILDIERGRYAEAVAGLRRAAAQFAAFGAINEQLTTLIGLARAQLEMLDLAGAVQTTDTFWSLASRSASPRLRHQLAIVRADVLAQCGRVQEARSLIAGLRRELELPVENDTAGRADALLARLALADGDAEQALRLAQAGRETLPEEQFAREHAQLWLVRLRALRALERDGEAEALLPQFAHWAERAGHPSATLYAGLATAEVDWSRSRRDAARRRYTELMNQAERSGIVIDLALVAQSYGGALLDSGDARAAAPVIARVSRWADADFGCAMLQVWGYWSQGDLDAWQRALQKARGLAGERPIAPVLTRPPQPAQIR
ncbi:MAG TPA: winged helix-turn-helix domain-containing protein, partial [Tahibacter sp.]|uniref:winged helix-turn-helix domain-containing protein n=1 Tax=Tahibacter sp. TaxID=2056211 RepID=UPI002CE8FB42